MRTTEQVPFAQPGAASWRFVISAFFDESGKFKDPKPTAVIAFGGIAGQPEDFSQFNSEWRRHCALNGLKCLSMKDALNHRVPLSKKRAAIGIKNRIDALTPFAICIRKYLQFVSSVAVDIAAWKKSPSHLRDLWTNDPVFMAFTRVLMATLEPLAPNDNLSIACDDEESTALGMFKLYRRVKQIWPSAKRRMAAISFADDEVFPQLQAADFISSLSRLEGHNKFHGESYDYSALFDTLNHPDPTDRLLVSGICFVSDDNLKSMADDMLELKKGTTT